MKIEKRELPSTVKELLQSIPETRDNDRLLVSEIWSKESVAKSADGLLSDIENDRISHFETITRIRRRLQEKNPDLRGKMYDARQHHANNYYNLVNF